jgi:hypothetical protein
MRKDGKPHAYTEGFALDGLRNSSHINRREGIAL